LDKRNNGDGAANGFGHDLMADDRLYAKLTQDFADSPKIRPLSDAAFRAYVETLLWSRRLLTDGYIPDRMMPQLMSADTLAELISNDDENPSIQQVPGGYIIHHYAEHQMTNEAIDKKREAGRKGAAIKYGKPENDAVEVRADVEKLCTTLAKLIEGNGVRKPTVTELWRKEARLLLDRDRVTVADALTVITWSQADPFWKSNILSMPKFRQQYARLKLQSEQVRKSNEDVRKDSEWDMIRKRDQAEKARGDALTAEFKRMAQESSAPPECRHGLSIVKCLTCSKELSGSVQ
jgi:hypothetical protein